MFLFLIVVLILVLAPSILPGLIAACAPLLIIWFGFKLLLGGGRRRSRSRFR